MIKWDFHDQIVVITGGTGGLGLALTRAFLTAGAKVHLCGLQDARTEATLAELGGQFAAERYQFHAVDVRNVQELQDWLKDVLKTEPKVDVLINAAGVCSTVETAKIDEKLWDLILDVNLKGTFFASQVIAEAMKAQGHGRIVNISSVSAYNGGTLVSPPYGASKAGIIALTKSFTSIYSPYGVSINAVAPGPFETDMISVFTEEGRKNIKSKTPDGLIGQPEDIVHSVLFLSDAAAARRITGASFDINGGLYMR